MDPKMMELLWVEVSTMDWWRDGHVSDDLYGFAVTGKDAIRMIGREKLAEDMKCELEMWPEVSMMYEDIKLTKLSK